MAKYLYRAKARNGQLKNGEISAVNKVAAKASLANKGLKVINLTTQDDSESKTGGNFITRMVYRDKNGGIQIRLGSQLPTTRELALFTKQFSLMIENGIPMLQALQMLGDQQRKQDFAEIIMKVNRSIEAGSTLTDSLESYPLVFDPLYVAMTKAGEASGRLDVILKQLVTYIEKAAKLKAQ
ncbi:MAG: hypothetical protein EOP10_33830, partial [Proteobacteria bacterium]